MNAAAAGKGAQQRLVNAAVERRQLKPRVQMNEHLLAGRAGDQMLQEGGVAAAKAAALRDQPAVEQRTAVDLQSVEKVAREQRGQMPQPLGRERLDALPRRSGDLDRINEAVRQIERDGIPAGVDPTAVGLVNQAPDLAQAPAQFTARVVGHVPQQFAELAAARRLRSNRQVAEQRPHLARWRQRHCGAVAGDA